jgi:hypothetical protein
MGMREERQKVDAGRMTVGELRKMLEAAPRGGVSRCNPSLSRGWAIDTLTEALKGRPDDEVIVPFLGYDGYGRKRQSGTGDRLLARNIIRECLGRVRG